MDGTHGTRAEGVDPGPGAAREGPLPVVIVGAGLAGLCCALHLERAGVPVRLLEASDAPGGVVRTDRVSGFRLDRGFQVLQTAYPEARCVLDYEALRLHAFHPGARIRWRGAWRRVGDPFRRPLDGVATLVSGIPTPGDALRVARLRADVRAASLEALMQRPARSTADALRERGFSERMIRGFFRPFYRGVFLEPELSTSSRLFEFTFRMFASGDACLPAEGMEAIPRQLAARLRPGTLRTATAVAAVDDAGVTTRDGERIAARAVVVATDAETAAGLLPELAPPAWNAVTCVYFDAPAPPMRGPTLALNGDEPGPVSHLCVPSEVAPTYAPAGRALVSASCLEGATEPDALLADRTRAQLRGWFGAAVDDWSPLGVVRVPRALPRQTPASLDPVTRPVHVGGRRFVCGGHRETSSIGGAMRAGRRAARAVRETLGGGRASPPAARPAGAPALRAADPPAGRPSDRPVGRGEASRRGEPASRDGTAGPADRDGRRPSTG